MKLAASGNQVNAQTFVYACPYQGTCCTRIIHVFRCMGLGACSTLEKEYVSLSFQNVCMFLKKVEETVLYLIHFCGHSSNLFFFHIYKVVVFVLSLVLDLELLSHAVL